MPPYESAGSSCGDSPIQAVQTDADVESRAESVSFKLSVMSTQAASKKSNAIAAGFRRTDRLVARSVYFERFSDYGKVRLLCEHYRLRVILQCIRIS